MKGSNNESKKKNTKVFNILTGQMTTITVLWLVITVEALSGHALQETLLVSVN